tara:strand:- start:1476 stop:2060 length:585 start_codon:yes stop_codon:yes gene_type:complete
MDIKSIEFKGSFFDSKKSPKDFMELAFVGLSNVGKSSFINYISNKKKIAKTSNTPGKTISLNYYLVNEKIYFVDLPGYGYAKLNKKEIEKINLLIKDYIKNSPNLFCLFVLIDCRHPDKEKNTEFINWLGFEKIPFCIILTKSDKLSKNKLKNSIEKLKKSLKNQWETMPEVIISSSTKRTGKKELFEFISKHL